MEINDYIIPIPLSIYAESLDDWEIVEWISRFEATSKHYRNGATLAEYDELLIVWNKRYPGEKVPILECVPPLDCQLNIMSMYRIESIESNSEEETNDE